MVTVLVATNNLHRDKRQHARTAATMNSRGCGIQQYAVTCNPRGTCVSFITVPHPTRSVADMSHRMMPSRSSGVVALRLTVTCGQVELWVRCTTRVEAFRKTSRKPCIGFKGLPLPE